MNLTWILVMSAILFYILNKKYIKYTFLMFKYNKTIRNKSINEMLKDLGELYDCTTGSPAAEKSVERYFVKWIAAENMSAKEECDG